MIIHVYWECIYLYLSLISGLFCNRHGKQTSIPITIMGDTWWVIIICPCVNVFSLTGGVTEADVGFPTVKPNATRYSLWWSSYQLLFSN